MPDRPADSAAPIALQTFDVWDTLLRRRCHPDEVKLFTARALQTHYHALLANPDASHWDLMHARVRCERRIGQRTRAEHGLDDEYELHDVLTEWVRAVCRLTEGSDPAAIARHLARMELEQELRVSYPDPRGRALARAACAGKTAAVSDFYMPQPMLRRLLDTHLPDVHFHHVFVSCDARLNKRSGRLYDHIHRTLNVQPDRHAHTGDNFDTDVRRARERGVRAVHFRNAPEDRLHDLHQQRFALRPHALDPTWDLLQQRLLAVRAPDDWDHRRRALFRAGVRMAPVFVALCALAAEHAARLGLQRVFYFTREGEFFRRVHQAIAPHQPTGGELPEPVLLHVSRMATFFPSLKDFSPDELMRLWRMYPWQSMRQFFSSLHVDLFAAEPFLRRYGLDPDTTICGIFRDNRVRALLKDPLFRRLLARAQQRRRHLLRRYLRSRGFTPDLPHAVIVDIGWRGTIQDNIACLFPNTTVHGFYLGLLRFLNPQPPNAPKTALGPDANRDDPATADIIRFVVPFEMVCNSGGGSVREYVPDHRDRALPSALVDPGERGVYQRFTRFFQAGAIAAAPVVADWMRTHAVSPAEMRPHCLDLMRALEYDPPHVVTQAFFALSHNETFGAGGFVRKGARLPVLKYIHARLSNRAWDRFARFCEDTTWPQGYLRYYRLNRSLRRYLTWATPAPPAPPRVPAPSEILEAKQQLQRLESSAAWRLLMAAKRLPIYRIYAKKRYGEGWDRAFDNETPVQRLNRLRSGTAYHILSLIGAVPDRDDPASPRGA